MNHPDPRIQRTQTALAQAMLALTLEKGYAAVTIRDLAERAGIGYATFFRHYPHKAALLDDVLAVFVEELLALLAAGGAASPAERGALIFRYIETHEALARVLLASQDLSTLVRRLAALSAGHLPTPSQPPAGPAIPPELAANHLIVASIGLIQWWLDHGCPYPAERMGEIYAALVIAPAQEALPAPRA